MQFNIHTRYTSKYQLNKRKLNKRFMHLKLCVNASPNQYLRIKSQTSVCLLFMKNMLLYLQIKLLITLFCHSRHQSEYSD